MNPLIAYKMRTNKSFTQMARECGISISTLHRHAMGTRGITLAFAKIYNSKFKIPFSKMPTEAEVDADART